MSERAMRIPKYIGVLEDRRQLRLPDDAVTQGFAILARRRSGKSMLAGVMMEIFSERGDPWVCLDPAGAHWGIKYRDAGGTPGDGSGLDVLVIGGKYGDVALDEHMGAAFAEIVCETNICCVIDLKLARVTVRKRFVTDFANRLFEINETPRHVFLEEAHEFVPQTPRFEEQKHVLNALDRLIKGGGGQGIGFTLITQRPASVNKDALTQIDNLFTLRMSGPQDLDAVKAWFQHNVGGTEELNELMRSLPSFRPGEAWLLSPDWLEKMERLKVRERVTYHAGRTPKRGEGPVQARELDMSTIIGRFRAASEQHQVVVKEELDARAEVKELRKTLAERQAPNGTGESEALASQVAELGDELAKRREENEGLRTAAAEHQRVVREVLGPIQSGLGETLQSLGFATDELGSALGEMQGVADQLRRLAEVEPTLPAAVAGKAPAIPRSIATKAKRPRQESGSSRAPAPAPAPAEEAAADGVTEAQQRLLNALVMLEGAGVREVLRVALAPTAGASPKSGSYHANLKRLKEMGLLEYPSPSRVSSTLAGQNAAEEVEPLSSVRELHERWCKILTAPQAELLRALIRHYPESVTREALAEEVGVSDTSGAFHANVKRLRSLGVADYPRPSSVAGSADLFPSGLAS